MTLSKYVLAIILLSGSFRPAGAASPQTRAEISEYRQTSSLEDVERFLEKLQEQKEPVSLEYIADSHLGERIPMVICSRPLITSPESARKLGRPVVYVQANIHGGEVEGKEAVQMILRDRLGEPPGGVLDKIVLLAVPVFNIDGNEALGPQQTNRSRQNGPQQVGQRVNGQGLDLNRDYVKLETPEVRGSLQHVFERWDPDVFIDLHATNGTIHGYQLTYSPPLNPSTEEGVLHFTRDELLPKVREILDHQYGLKTFDYGNLLRSGDYSAWHTYDPDPRYATNYVGLRNRISILSEAMSYLSFKDRVTATYHFVNTILDQVASEGARIVELTRRADLQVTNWGNDPQTAPALGVRFERAQRGREGILLEKSDTPG
ncbi:MAG: M14 family metallopeptidase, partial [Planctomycetota bacterium]